MQEGSRNNVLLNMDILEKDVALNDWVDRNLTNYVKKQMATPEDPVRKLAEEGIVHIPSNEVGINRYRAPKHRERYGGEQLGQSEAAKAWEDASDVAINAPKVEEIISPGFISRNPYVEKLSPDERIYGLNSPASYQQEIKGLGFDHIMDVLRQDVAAGRIRPEQLNKVSMEQAVRRTYEYDQEMARKMRETALKQQNDLSIYKDYPDQGYKWVDLSIPEEEMLPKGYKIVRNPDVVTPKDGEPYMMVDPQGEAVAFGRTPGDIMQGVAPDMRPGYEKLKQILDYEGNTMGHCVGSYCDEVSGGGKKIYSLRDSRGEPHVTIEVLPDTTPPRIDQIKKYMAAATEEAMQLPQGYTSRDISDIATRMAMENAPPTIMQIKGKQNRAPKDEYLPFVQDFVRSRDWQEINDLHNTGLMSLDDAFPDYEMVKAFNRTYPDKQFVNKKEVEDFTKQFNNPQPPQDGMKRGGKVSISSNPDTMMLELGNKRMKEGGSEADTKPYFGGAGTKKYAAAKKRAEQADVNLLKDPKTYAAIMGLLGEAPDQMGFSVMHPDYQGIKEVADPAFYAGTALGVAPLMKAFKAPTMALGRAGEKYAEKVVPQIMERGGLGADILSGLTQGARSNLDVWHGSPHKFPPTAKNPLGEFDPTKMGTGEGSQAYGFGHYTAEAKDVAKTYQPRSPQYEEKLLGLYDKAQRQNNYPMMEVLEDAMLHRDPEEILTKFANTEDGYTPQHIKAAKDFAKWYEKNPPEVGGLYKVDLSDEAIAKMLDYDKPWKQQPKNVQDAINIDKLLKYYNTEDLPISQVLYHANQNMSPAEFSEFLRSKGIPGIKYLDEKSRAAGEGTRNFVVFPGEEDALTILDRKKSGGKVSISNSPDTMILELNQQKMKNGEPAYAGGKLVTKQAAKAAKVQPPIKFPVTRGPSIPEIRAMAERMAPQVMGEFVRAAPSPSKPNPSESVVGKSRKQFEREKTLPIQYQNIMPEVTPNEFDYAKNKGALLIGTSGDVTPGNRLLLSIDNQPLSTPVHLQAGPEWELYNPSAWAASDQMAKTYMKRAEKAADAYGAEPYLHYHKMTPDANWYAMHHLNSILGHLRPEELKLRDPKLYQQMVEEIRTKDVGFGKHPEFEGFDDPLNLQIHAQIDPNFRRHLGAIFGGPKFTERYGLNSGQDVLAATSLPELRDLEPGASGYAIVPLDVKAPLKNFEADSHTYDTGFPKAGPSGRSKYPSPYQLIYRDTLNWMKDNPSENKSSEFGRMNMIVPKQQIDNELIDAIGEYQRRMKELTGKKKGGAIKKPIKKAAGGAITGDDLIIEERPL